MRILNLIHVMRSFKKNRPSSCPALYGNIYARNTINLSSYIETRYSSLTFSIRLLLLIWYAANTAETAPRAFLREAVNVDESVLRIVIIYVSSPPLAKLLHHHSITILPFPRRVKGLLSEAARKIQPYTRVLLNPFYFHLPLSLSCCTQRIPVGRSLLRITSNIYSAIYIFHLVDGFFCFDGA